jgi:hypothetical protein
MTETKSGHLPRAIRNFTGSIQASGGGFGMMGASGVFALSGSYSNQSLPNGIHDNASYNIGDLRAKYLAGDAGAYTRSGNTWTKK